METIQPILDALKTTPMETILSAMFIAFLLGIGKIGFEYVSIKLNNMKITKEIEKTQSQDKPSEKRNSVSDLPPLTDSPLFTSIEWQKTVVKTSISTGNKGKDLMLQEIGIHKLDAWKKHLYKLAEEIESHIDDGTEEECYTRLFDKNVQTFNEAFLEYNNFWHNNPNYTEDEKFCLDHVMPIINKHHQSNVDNTLEAIRYACESKFYNNCVSRQSTVYFSYSGALNEFTMEIQRAFNEINGHLAGRVFKGVTI